MLKCQIERVREIELDGQKGSMERLKYPESLLYIFSWMNCVTRIKFPNEHAAELKQEFFSSYTSNNSYFTRSRLIMILTKILTAMFLRK